MTEPPPERRNASPATSLPRSRRRRQLAISIDFQAWPEWQDAFRVLLAQSRARHITRVGVSAGRTDWTFYRSTHDPELWSDLQRARSEDMVEVAVDALAEREICATAVLDAAAPRYLQRRPQYAAADLRGRQSAEIVCSTALAEGEYGRILLDAFEALAAHTAADSVAVTNVSYGWHCFCRRCLLRFREYAWRTDWPRLPNGAVDLLDPAIGEWRSGQVAEVVACLSTAARAHGKRMIFDAKLSRDDLSRNSSENGQDYSLLRHHVDEFVLAEHFAVDELGPGQTTAAARYLCRELGADNYWYSVRLWQRGALALEAEQMRLALLSAWRGGARRLWIAPSHYLSPLHWQRLDELMSREDIASEPVG